ncbi:MAG: Rrf2 family transcriptional regulator [Phycisphaerales bacterium]
MFSQTVEYALRAMMHLTANPATPLTSEAIAASTSVPSGYLSKVLRDLVRADLISSARGPRGGFRLAREPSRISILDVVNAVDPIQRISRCPIGNPNHTRLCALHRSLDNALATVESALRASSLADMLAADGLSDGCGRPPPAERPATMQVTYGFEGE